MDQDDTWHVGRLRPRPYCVGWGPSSPSPKRGHPQFSAHVYCGQMAGRIKVPLGTNVGDGLGHIALHGDPPPPKGHSPQFSAHVYCARGRSFQLLLSSCFTYPNRWQLFQVPMHSWWRLNRIDLAGNVGARPVPFGTVYHSGLRRVGRSKSALQCRWITRRRQPVGRIKRRVEMMRSCGCCGSCGDDGNAAAWRWRPPRVDHAFVDR